MSKKNILKIKLKFFQKSYDECKNYIDEINNCINNNNNTFSIYLINYGSDFSKIHNFNNALYLAELLNNFKNRIIKIKIFGNSLLIDSAIFTIKNLFGNGLENIVEYAD